MYLFEIVSMEPLEPYENMKYGSLAGNGDSLFFLEKGGTGVIHHGLQPGFPEKHDAARIYSGICYDSVDDCYWGCIGKNSDIVYRLSTSFREVDRFRFCDYDVSLGAIRAISWDRQDDCLILTYANGVKSVDKHSFCELPVSHCAGTGSVHACTRSCGDYYYLERCCDMEILSIVRDGKPIIHSCLPCCHRFLGMVETCDEHGPVISFLCVKHGTYHYILKGVLVERNPLLTSDACKPEERRENCCQPHQDTHSNNRRPHRCRDTADENQHDCHNGYRRDCHYHHYRPIDTQEQHCHHDRDHKETDHSYEQYTMWQYRYGTYASVIESIALEQTALSHILNAEGEKIQRVIAVSDQPEDFLDVNRSVLETITKVTHLEQVLFSKLELACRALLDSEGRAGDGA